MTANRRSPLAGLGAALLLALAAVALFAPFLAPYEPRALVGKSLESPSGRHPLGTNDVGQDILSQLVWGSRHSLVVALSAAALTVAVGVVVGMASSMLGGLAELVFARTIDVFLALPILPLLVVVAALAGPSVFMVVLTLGLFGWPVIARVVRAQALSLRQRGFVGAARGFGGGFGYVLRRHLVPALGPVVAVAFVTMAGAALFLESGLAFLGLGDPTTVSWGMVLNRALTYPGVYFSSVWTWWVFPAAAAITLAVLGFTFLGLGLDPRFNPRLERRV